MAISDYVLGPLGKQIKNNPSAIRDWLMGKPSQTIRQPIYTEPGQENILSQITGGVQGQLPGVFQYLQNILGDDPSSLAAFQAPARRGFAQQTVPTIAERFSSLGAGAQGSSAFNQAMGQAGRELEENLFSQQIGMKGGAIKQLMQLFPQALTPREYEYDVPAEQGMLQQLLIALAQGAGGAIGGGIPGAAVGAGQGLAGLFKTNQ